MSGDRSPPDEGAVAMKCEISARVIAAGNAADPGWDAACQHLAECAECQQAFRTGDVVDQQMTTLISKVAIPVGLDDRILRALERASRSVTAAKADSLVNLSPVAEANQSRVIPKHLSRRRILVAAAAVAGCAFLGIGYFLWDASQKVTAEHLLEVVAQNPPDPRSLPPFAGFSRGVVLRVPREIQISQRLDEAAPKRLMIGRHSAAAYFFSVPTDRQTVLDGWVFAIPKHVLVNPPDWEGFDPNAVNYTQKYPACIWREGDLVYVCCLTGGGGEDDLNRLFPLQQAT